MVMEGCLIKGHSQSSSGKTMRDEQNPGATVGVLTTQGRCRAESRAGAWTGQVGRPWGGRPWGGSPAGQGQGLPRFTPLWPLVLPPEFHTTRGRGRAGWGGRECCWDGEGQALGVSSPHGTICEKPWEIDHRQIPGFLEGRILFMHPSICRQQSRY